MTHPTKIPTATRLKSYLNKPLYLGRGIRWLLEDETGTNVYCFKCGNIANGVMKTKRRRGTYYIPLCKTHFHKAFPDVEFVPSLQTYNKPSRVKPKLPYQTPTLKRFGKAKRVKEVTK